ncbi:GNAT family N-acetyltransferase [Chitinophaga sp. GCM10012297]|uniref:GNAT family N-acetyltransferase n=1 Tax=Chitinophaga chungangae TaxID=2821488 RepID=A0ABS3YBN3_9BACT|nr:GNAT family N-acetyltransferase [Chitinophaga chungangae]MBO9152087.1 GNAT family N-acetyltransferase [Chitinophaga chungangae]
MEQIRVREATLKDLDVLLSFEQGIIAAERPFDSTIREGEVHYYDIAAMIYEPHISVVVAELDGQVIGSGYARIEEAKHYLKHPQHAYLGFMYVLPEFRGRGVNRAIVENLAGWARSRGITEIVLDVYDANEPAVRAYEKAGFTRHLLQMRMPV